MASLNKKNVRSYKSASKNTPELILDAAEELMSRRGFHGVSIREIANLAEVHLGSVTYHFGTKENLLEAIYERHAQPMNLRRSDLLAEAARITNLSERLLAIVRAFVVPAFSSQSDVSGGGARFTRVRAILSMEGNEAAQRIIASNFDETSAAFVDAVLECCPRANRSSVVWRCHFLLGSLYYTLVSGERIDRLTHGDSSGADHHRAIDELSHSFAAAFSDLQNNNDTPVTKTEERQT
ncbi:MAG: TetR family transcriptional regulator [Hyphomicrobiales bacterium]|nr:MAG: TetR family transcriptional regulator [Hyphomicrobiales bacterium]